MRYVLKYEMKSKYFGFTKVYYKEFNSIFEMNQFMKNDSIRNCKVYERLTKENNNEKRNAH